MSSREGRKAATREARIAAEARVRAERARRRRLRALAGIVLTAAAVVAVAVAISSGGSANAASGGRLVGAAFSSNLFAGIPQHGTVLGRSNAPVKMVEFADLQCPYCDAYSVQTLPTLVNEYVRPGKLQLQFENLSFIGPGSVAAGRVAAAAARQDKLWNFVDLLYLNQGRENTGYVTPAYLRRLLRAIPQLNVAAAISGSQTPSADAALSQANEVASQDGINATPSFLIGKTGGTLHQFQGGQQQWRPDECRE